VSRIPNQADYSHVSCLLADTRVTPPFNENSPLNLLQESQAGAIFPPETLEFTICAPKVASLSQPAIEHFLGQDLPVAFIQCCFQDPHLHERFPVPALFFQPSAGNDIEYLPLFVNSSQNSELIPNQPQSALRDHGWLFSVNQLGETASYCTKEPSPCVVPAVHFPVIYRCLAPIPRSGRDVSCWVGYLVMVSTYITFELPSLSCKNHICQLPPDLTTVGFP